LAESEARAVAGSTWQIKALQTLKGSSKIKCFKSTFERTDWWYSIPDLCSSVTKSMDWIVQCFTSPPTQYRLYGRRFLQVKRPNQQYQSTEGDATKDKANNENNW